VKAMIFGAFGADKLHNALKRILEKVRGQHFNSLEVTGIVERRFLGLPYTVVSEHSRHVQPSCYLDSAEARRRPPSTMQPGPETERTCNRGADL
ncbi:MAG TPA: hypothetical protein VFV92_06905, partial [Candidatus Bathyarchaeia archaeon]|nr:hypothetical protein [Candidatus Bathyarchaeia archaeon]